MLVSGNRSGDSVTVRLLLDTNVFIKVEPFSGATESDMSRGTRLLRLAAEHGHALCVHRATVDDIRNDQDVGRRNQRLAEVDKYEMLEDAPQPNDFLERVGRSDPGTNDYNDLRLIAALAARAATHLVSEDVRLRRRAGRAGLGDAVLTIDEATELLERFTPTRSAPPPLVKRIEAYQLDTGQPIFDSLRDDYDDFDQWVDRVRADWKNRINFVIETSGTYAGLALLKRESPCEYDFPRPVLKLATIKVGEGFSGSKYGELLLKTVFRAANDEGAGSLYVEVFPHHELLIQLLGEFGFEETHHKTSRNELVLLKRRQPETSPHLDDLAFHVRYGPPALRRTNRYWLVPIEPRWHEQLFPDCPSEQPMLPGSVQETRPWGNALRKAYLSNSATQRVQPGDVLLFYRSRDAKSVSVVGVVEKTLRSRDPTKILTFVGKRSVYSPDQIVTMCTRVRPVLALLFRQDRFVNPHWTQVMLNRQGVVAGWPQTIGRVRKDGIQWLNDQLDASH